MIEKYVHKKQRNFFETSDPHNKREEEKKGIKNIQNISCSKG